MPSLLTPIKTIHGVGPAIAERFQKLGLLTLQDVLFHFPFRHQDWRRRVPIDEVTAGQEVTILGQVVKISGRSAWRRRGLHVTEAIIIDESGATLSVVWFNQPYLVKTFKVNDHLFLSGKITTKKEKIQLQNPMYERPTTNPTHEKLVPIYPATEGLSQWQIRKIIKLALPLAGLLPETLPAEIIQHYTILPRAEALQQIHFPHTPEQATRAVTRLKLDELLAWQLQWQQAAGDWRKQTAPAMVFQEPDIQSFVGRLPFKLTDEQRKAAWQILQDLTLTKPMSRLLQGDVGSGKTVVAALAAYNAIKNGRQAVLLAPTVILAEQHWQTLRRVLQPQGVRLGLLTSSTVQQSNDDRCNLTSFRRRLSRGEIDLVVGTHAVLSPEIAWHNLGLVIVDEQQRFGVAQRQALLDKQQQANQPTPHFLSLTATQIPRTLALFMTGELDISVIKGRPPGRLPIATEVIGPKQRSVIDRAIESTVTKLEQIYVITPLIEESDSLGVRAATVEYERLKKQWPKLRLGLVHGSMPADDRIGVLDKFRRSELDLVVSTTVIEVGIDVPNATLMIIEGAERFGLAQLHQLRGRVGRSDKPSRCLLVTDQSTASVKQRLTKVATIDDGLALAEQDLQARGAGDLYGVRQSGLPDWKLASLQDGELMTTARTIAQELLTKYPDWLKSPNAAELQKLTASWHRE